VPIGIKIVRLIFTISSFTSLVTNKRIDEDVENRLPLWPGGLEALETFARWNDKNVRLNTHAPTT